MGLMIHSLALLPKDSNRDYYVYLLDYGWTGSLGQVLFDNYDRLSHYASKNNFVVLRGTPGSHFEDEVFSWHHINGENGDDVLPAILITTLNPYIIHQECWDLKQRNKSYKDKMLLIPIRKICKTNDDVVRLIEKVIVDLVEKKSLKDFSIAKELKGGKGKTILDALILEPNFNGVGVDIKKIIEFFGRD